MKTGKHRLDEINAEIEQGDRCAKRIIRAPRRIAPPPRPQPLFSAQDIPPSLALPSYDYMIDTGKSRWGRLGAFLAALRDHTVGAAELSSRALTAVIVLALFAGVFAPLIFLCVNGAWFIALLILVGLICAPEFGVPFLLIFSALLILGWLAS